MELPCRKVYPAIMHLILFYSFSRKETHEDISDYNIT